MERDRNLDEEIPTLDENNHSLYAYFRDPETGKLWIKYVDGAEEQIRIGLLRQAVNHKVRSDLAMLMGVDLEIFSGFKESLLSMASLMLSDEEFEVFDNLFWRIDSSKPLNREIIGESDKLIFEFCGIVEQSERIKKDLYDALKIIPYGSLRSEYDARRRDLLTNFREFLEKVSKIEKDADYVKKALSSSMFEDGEYDDNEFNSLKQEVAEFLVDRVDYDDLVQRKIDLISPGVQNNFASRVDFHYATLLSLLGFLFLSLVFAGLVTENGQLILLTIFGGITVSAGLGKIYRIGIGINKKVLGELFREVKLRKLDEGVLRVCDNVDRLINQRSYLRMKGEVDTESLEYFESSVSDLKQSVYRVSIDAISDREIKVDTGVTLPEVDTLGEEVGEEVSAESKVEV